MSENQSLLIQLQNLLTWKKSKKFYADKLGVTEECVDDLLKELRDVKPVQVFENNTAIFKEDIVNGTGEIVLNVKEEIKSLEELIEKSKIDVSVWEITKYVQNYWGNTTTPNWQVKAWLSKKSEATVFQNEFISFLKEYKPTLPSIGSPKVIKDVPEASLIINKQDSHFNKLDVDGSNNINDRFAKIREKVEVIVNQALVSNLVDTIYYVIGSDEFNSEFNGTTTKGTPQQNILSYHKSFEKICNHEVDMINFLASNCFFLNVIYVPGNHDEYVGWHLVKWLETYYKSEEHISFETSPKYRKYVSYGKTAIMFNHGDAMKPAKLAGIFPIEYKDKWSSHENFYIFTGDKHHEVSHDFGGIKFYQIPAFSNAKSSWDDKNGYTGSRGEVTGFLIDHLYGMTNIYKQYL